MEGKSNKAICRTLDLAEPTVKYHVTTILKALKVSNRTEAVLTIGRLGWKLPPTTNNKQNAEGIDENEQSTTKTVLAPTPKAQSKDLIVSRRREGVDDKRRRTFCQTRHQSLFCLLPISAAIRAKTILLTAW